MFCELPRAVDSVFMNCFYSSLLLWLRRTQEVMGESFDSMVVSVATPNALDIILSSSLVIANFLSAVLGQISCDFGCFWRIIFFIFSICWYAHVLDCWVLQSEFVLIVRYLLFRFLRNGWWTDEVAYLILPWWYGITGSSWLKYGGLLSLENVSGILWVKNIRSRHGSSLLKAVDFTRSTSGYFEKWSISTWR